MSDKATRKQKRSEAVKKRLAWARTIRHTCETQRRQVEKLEAEKTELRQWVDDVEEFLSNFNYVAPEVMGEHGVNMHLGMLDKLKALKMILDGVTAQDIAETMPPRNEGET